MQGKNPILDEAKRFEPYLISFLQDLVKIASINGKNPEKYIADRIIQEAKLLNLNACLVSKINDRPNVLVNLGSGKHGFLLVAHLDTVPVGNAESWTHHPFDAEIKNGILYGRGSADNKAGIACSLYTLALIQKLNLIDLSTSKVIFAGVADEESGASSPIGMRYLLEQKQLPVQAAIYTYTSDIICIGHRGLLRFELTSVGETIHTGSEAWSQKECGVNAVTALCSVLLKLEKLNLSVPKSPAFQHLNCTITPGTTFQGGEWQGMVPALAKATVDVRMLPGQTSEEILKTLQSIIQEEMSSRPGLNITFEVTINLPSVEIPIDDPLVKITKKIAQAISGHEWAARGAGPANEGYMLIQAGIPTLCGFGAKGGNPHAPDEWVEVASLTETVAIYAGIIQEYLLNS